MAYLKFECDGVPLSLVRQQIQTLDYELHASLRIVAGGRLLDSEHMTAFMNALAEGDQLMSGGLLDDQAALQRAPGIRQLESRCTGKAALLSNGMREIDEI
jgi:hypothetical protein